MKKQSYYKLNELVKAAKPFGRKTSANQKLEKDLRELEAKKKNIDENDVTEVSYDTFCTAIRALTACHTEVIAAILYEFKRLGYQAIEK